MVVAPDTVVERPNGLPQSTTVSPSEANHASQRARAAAISSSSAAVAPPRYTNT
jgi:hypothetical protein